MIITIVRKPFKGALINNIRESQCGGLSIDLCRISINEGSTENGRWPANFILNPKLANLLPAQAGGRWGKVKAKQPKSMFFGNHTDHTDHDEKFKRDCEKFTGDVGPAARFFLQVKE